MQTPKVCICIPCYNSSQTITETIVSIQNQTFRNIAIKVVDNASTDNTLQIVKAFAKDDPRIIIHTSDRNLGGEANFSRCITLSNGEYTAIYHADDVYCPEIVEQELNLLESNKEIGAVFTNAIDIDENGKPGILRKIPKDLTNLKRNIYSFNEVLSAVLKNGNYFMFPSALIRTDIFKNEIVCWREDLFKTSGDLDVWLRISRNHKIGIINKPLIKYRMSKYGYTFKIARSEIKDPDIFLVLDHYIKEHSSILTPNDLNNYQRFKFRCRTIAAFNCLLQKNKADIASKISFIFNKKSVFLMLNNIDNIRRLLTAYGIYVLSAIPFDPKISKILFFLRFGRK